MKLIVTAVVVVFAVAAAGAAYLRVGWWRMESECGSNPPGAIDRGSVAYSWSWQPVGFTCSYEDGHSKTSLWF